MVGIISVEIIEVFSVCGYFYPRKSVSGGGTYQLSGNSELIECLLHGTVCFFGGVAVLTDVSEHDVLQTGMGYLAYEVSGLLVGEVAPVAFDSFDEGHGAP